MRTELVINSITVGVGRKHLARSFVGTKTDGKRRGVAELNVTSVEIETIARQRSDGPGGDVQMKQGCNTKFLRNIRTLPRGATETVGRRLTSNLTLALVRDRDHRSIGLALVAIGDAVAAADRIVILRTPVRNRSTDPEDVVILTGTDWKLAEGRRVLAFKAREPAADLTA